MATQDHVASVFLHALGAPDTPDMRAAVKAWMRAEGVSTSSSRNNPWNLHAGPICNSSSHYCVIPKGSGLPGQIGTYNAGPGDKNVAVFDTMDHGIQASAQNLIRLSGSGYGYDHVIAKARAGDPVGFLNALALSSWSAGRYGTRNGGNNKLLTLYAGITGYTVDPKSYQSLPWYAPSLPNPSGEHSGVGQSPGNGSDLPDNPFVRALQRYMAANKIDPNSTITSDQFWAAVKGLPGMTPDSTEAQMISKQFIGKTWTQAIEIGKQGMAGPNTDPLAALAGFIGKLSDPATWAKLLALMLGVGLAAYGGVNIYRATA